MYTPVSLQELDNARQDVESLEKVVNGKENEDVTTRLGETYPTLSKFINNSETLVQSSIDAVIDGSMITDELVSVGGGETQADKNAEFELDKFDTGITATAKFGGVERTQSDVNSDIVSIKNFPTLAAAETYATTNSVKVFIPSGEHEYNLTNADMTLFWGYGQLKDTTTGAIYKPKNGDFVTPEMFGIREKVDETVKLKAMTDYAAANSLPVKWKGGAEYHYQEIVSEGEGYSYDWSVIGSGSVTFRSLKSSAASGFFEGNSIALSGVQKDTIPFSNSCVVGATDIKLQNVVNVVEGDLLLLYTTRLAEGDNRGQLWEGQLAKVRKVNSVSKTVTIDAGARNAYKTGVSMSGVITSVVDGFNVVVSGINTDSRNATILMTMTSGVNSGITRKVTAWNNSTKTINIEGYQAAFTGLQVGDAFTLTQESYAIHVKPCYANIVGDFKIVRTPMSANSTATSLHRGFMINMADNPSIRNLDVTGFGETGIWLRRSYEPYLDNSSITGANRSFADNGTGYGVSIYECFRAVVNKTKVFKSRKGFDVGGSYCQTHDTLITACHTDGGGIASNGAAFFPFGSAKNGGFGTHGSGVNTRYVDCTANNVKQGFQFRGLRETINDCRILGNCGSIVHLQAGGGGVSIDNLQYLANFNAISDVSKDYYDQLIETPLAFMSIESDEILSTQPITITNCTARGIQKYFLTVVRGSTVPPINYGNNTVYAVGNTEFSWLALNRGAADVAIENINNMGGNRVFDPYNTYIKIGGTNDNLPTFRKEIQGLSDTYRATRMIPAKGAIKIHGFNSATGVVVTVIPVLSGRSYFLNRAILYTNTAEDKSPESATNKVNFNVFNRPLGDISDPIPHLKFGISYSPNKDGVLHIENGSNREELMYIEVNGLTL